MEGESDKRISLKDTAFCDCRSGIRYLNKDYLKKKDENLDLVVWRSVGICAAVFAGAGIGLQAVLGLPDDYNRGWDLPVAVLLLLLMIASLIGGVASFFHPIELLFRNLEETDPAEYYEDTIRKIQKMIYDYQTRMRKQREIEENKEKKRKSGSERTARGNVVSSNRIDSAVAGAAGYAVASYWEEDEPDFGASDSYVPDDFEPDLDPYDRQALYDEEVIDDWVIAGGGNPFDFDDRMDALSDPFGFGGDGDSWD